MDCEQHRDKQQTSKVSIGSKRMMNGKGDGCGQSLGWDRKENEGRVANT